MPTRARLVRSAPEVLLGFAIMFVCSSPPIAQGLMERELCRLM